MRTLILLLLINQVFAQSRHYRDRELKKKDAPAFLVEAVPRQGKVDDVEYFEKKYDDNKKTYELKYELNGAEVSLTYSEAGVLQEKEQDIAFNSLSSEVRQKIKAYLESRFPGHSINETELRTNSTKTEFIDVEISHKKISGYLEVSFTLKGDYVSEEPENAPSIETLN